MALVVAMTGGIGSGKSAAASILQELGAAVIDTDEIAHKLTAAGAVGAAAIATEFGSGYLRDDGALDRQRMRELVFNDTAAKRRLEAILHPLIRQGVRSALQAAQAPYIVIVVPLLIESGAYRELASRVLVVDCDENTQVARVMKRSGLSAESIRAIMANQVSREVRLKYADDIISNDADEGELRAKMLELHEKYLELSRAEAHPA